MSELDDFITFSWAADSSYTVRWDCQCGAEESDYINEEFARPHAEYHYDRCELRTIT